MKTPVVELLAQSSQSLPARPEGDSTDAFGPFGANERRLLMAVPSALGRLVSFNLGTDIEEPYDRVSVADGSGRIQEVSGKRQVVFAGLPTPVTVAFFSDYEGPSREVRIGGLKFEAQK
jgi:hypothetical protein